MKIFVLACYMLIGWMMGAIFSTNVALTATSTQLANFWFWGWIFLWPLFLAVKFALVFIIVVVVVFCGIYVYRLIKER